MPTTSVGMAPVQPLMPDTSTIFVYEYLTSGACHEIPLDSSMMAEGRAMSDAVMTDFATLEDLQVVTLRDARLTSVQHPDVTTRVVNSTSEEENLFSEFCNTSDHILIIAPETDGILQQRVQIARQYNSRSVLNLDTQSLVLTGDKWKLAKWCEAHQVPTIPTKLSSSRNPIFPPPILLKPREGAGCEEIRIIDADNLPS